MYDIIFMKLVNVNNKVNEDVKFGSGDEVRKGLEKKYGDGELKEYTFGIELEYKPESDGLLDKDRIRMELINMREVYDEYGIWLKRMRLGINKGIKSVEDWNGDYGPIDVGMFSKLDIEPSRSDVNGHREWMVRRKLVELDYNKFLKVGYNEYMDDYVDDLIESGDWVKWVEDESVFFGMDMDGEVNSAVSYIQNKMSERVKFGDSDMNSWGVGPDGMNVEIRSKHLRQDDFNLVRMVCDYVKGKGVSGDTSAHVHIGLPEDFDAFDLLAITTLVDERAIRSDVGSDRQLERWANLRKGLHNIIVDKLIRTDINQKSEGVVFVLSNEQLYKLLINIDRNFGTNVTSMSKNGTIEFRYFGSDVVVRNVNLFIDWIRYYLLLPKVAKSRNRVILRQEVGSDSQFIVCIRESGRVRFVLNGGIKVSGLNLPVGDIKKGVGLSNLKSSIK